MKALSCVTLLIHSVGSKLFGERCCVCAHGALVSCKFLLLLVTFSVLVVVLLVVSVILYYVM
jgi:hypothetical protein